MIFRRRKKEGTLGVSPGLPDKAARGIANSILKIQNSFAKYFGRKTKTLGRDGKIIFFGFVLVIFGGLSVYHLINVFYFKNSTFSSIRNSRVSLPRYFDQPTDGKYPDKIVVSEKLFHDIQLFKKYIDSLGNSKYGKPKRDSILQTRPGLLDSLRMLEQLYYEQQKLNR